MPNACTVSCRLPPPSWQSTMSPGRIANICRTLWAVPGRDQSRGSTFQSMGTMPLPAAVRRTVGDQTPAGALEQPWRLTRRVDDRRLGVHDLPPYLRWGSSGEGERVGHGVVTDRVPFLDDSPGKVGMRPGLPTDEGERRLDAEPGKQGEHLRGPMRVGPVIDSERDRGRARRGKHLGKSEDRPGTTGTGCTAPRVDVPPTPAATAAADRYSKRRRDNTAPRSGDPSPLRTAPLPHSGCLPSRVTGAGRQAARHAGSPPTGGHGSGPPLDRARQ